MKALILNSGMGSRMGRFTELQPKCMTEIGNGETILSRQLKLLEKNGIHEVVMTTGIFEKLLTKYSQSLNLSIKFKFVQNALYEETNYIYSIYLAREHLYEDIILLHGDLVFEESVLKDLLKQDGSCMAISSTLPLPIKDFKAVVRNNYIEKVGIDFFEDAVAAQPFYKLCKKDWSIWLDQITHFCETGNIGCYAENAFNEVYDICRIFIMDFRDSLCAEIDTPEDLKVVQKRLLGITR